MSLVDGGLEGLDVGGPVVGLIEVVWDALGIQKREGSGVEWVLWDWDENAGVWAGADDIQPPKTSSMRYVEIGRAHV